MKKTHLLPLCKPSLFVCLVFFLFSLSANGQVIEVEGAHNPPYTPEKLIENILLGNGVNIISTSYEGDDRAIGYFKNGQNDISLDRGLVLSTGYVEGSTNANTYDNSNPFGGIPDANGVTSGNTVSDPDLLALTNGGGLSDIAKIEITFQPYGDSLKFNYVFASEEYPIYSCLNFNDVFGFFISGPNPSGGNYVTENIAIVPGTSDTVSINNVHNGFDPDVSCTPKNNQFYNDNTGSTTFAYNAYLDIFEAKVAVVPCQTYTIKISIGDGSNSGNDNNFDSAVFLEAKSFESQTLNIDAVSVSLDGTIIEGCSQGELTFSLPYKTAVDYPLNYQISGTAVNALDYENIPNNLFIPAGDSTVSIPVIAKADNDIEGTETILVDVISSICKRDSFYFYIKDNVLIDPDLRNDTTICSGQSLQLDGTINVPVSPPQTFTNSMTTTIPDANPNPVGVPSGLYSSLPVSGVEPKFIVDDLIQNVCLNLKHSNAGQLEILLISPDGQFIELSTNNGGSGNDYTNTCFSPSATQSILDNGDPAPASMTPFTGSFQPEGVWSDLWDGLYASNGNWQLLIKDDTFGPGGSNQLLDWSITFNPLYELNYSWSPTAGLSCTDCPNPIASPSSTTKYYLTVSDSYGCEVQDSVTITIQDNLPAPTITCGTNTSSSVTFDWTAVTGVTAYEVNVNGGGWVASNNGLLSHQVTGLGLNEVVNIEVRAKTLCGADSGTASCVSSSCTPPEVVKALAAPITCFGESDASVSISTTSGTAPFTYELGGVTNTTGDFINLGQGKHYFTVTTADGCSTLDSIELSQPTQLTLTINKTDETCSGQNDGTATATPSGGTGSYTFEWDSNTGNQTAPTATMLDPGSYDITVYDSQGCEAVESVTIVAGKIMTTSFDSQNPTCHGAIDGSAQVNVTGGLAPLTYQWNDPTSSTSNQINNVGANTYSVTITDADGCSLIESVSLSAPSSLNSSFSSQPSSCFNSPDGSVTITPSGGQNPYTFKWDDMSNTNSRNDLLPGNYMVTVTDNNGCNEV